MNDQSSNVFICSETKVGNQLVSINLFEPLGCFSENEWERLKKRKKLAKALSNFYDKVCLPDFLKGRTFELWVDCKVDCFVLKID